MVLDGSVGKLDIKEGAAGAAVKIDSGNIDELKLQSKSSVQLSGGTVGKLDVKENAADSDVNLEKGAVIESLKTNAAVTVSGQGKIESAVINGTGVKIEQKPDSIKVSDGITATVGGAATTGTSNNNPAPQQPTNSGGSSGSSSSTSNAIPQTTAGSLTAAPGIVTKGAVKNIYITYINNSEAFSGGSVVFALPDQITASTGDTVSINNGGEIPLNTSSSVTASGRTLAISNSGKTVTLLGVASSVYNAPSLNVRLTLKNKSIPLTGDSFSFIAAADSDGPGTAKSESSGVSSTLASIAAVSDFEKDSKYITNTETTMRFNWTAVTSDTSSISIQQSPHGQNSWSNSLVAGSSLTVNSVSADVYGLSAHTSYDFKLVVNGGTNAGDSNIVQADTSSFNFFCNNWPVYAANFIWHTIAGATSIKIQQSTDNGNTWTDSATNVPLTAASTSGTVTGLSPNTSYKFKLVVTGGPNEGYTDIIDVHTDTDVIVSAISSTSVRISFGAISGLDTDTLLPENFSIKEAYGMQRIITVTGAALDTAYNNDTISNPTGRIGIILTTSPHNSATIYGLTSKGVKDSSGNNIVVESRVCYAGIGS